MRNKIFISIFCIFILAVFIAAPINHYLQYKDIIPRENVGNVIEVEKVYDEDFPLHGLFNGIEEGKRLINDTYINYIPFYLTITNATKDIQRKINYDLNQWYTKKGNDIYRENIKKAREESKK